MPNPDVPKGARVDRRLRADLKTCNCIRGQRLVMVEQPSVPQRIWHGLILLLSAAALFGGLSTPAVASACITSTTISNTVINNGCIATSVDYAHGIESTGDNATITNSNSGTITTSGADAPGIRVSDSGATISNLGTITAGGERSFGIKVNSPGSVTSLTNAQGGNTPLTYSGRLPSTYTARVQSLSSFGRLAVTSGTGTMTFAVDNFSVLAANRYTNVLTGVEASKITNEETESMLGNFAWKLTASSTANSWDLLVRLVDTTAPTVSIVVADTTLNAGETSLVTFTFSEAVTGFTNSDITFANGTLSAVSSSDSGITWTATFIPTDATADTTNVITVDMTGVMDLAQNTGVGTTDSNNYAVNTGSPATEFASKTATIRQTLTDTATSSLTSALSANQAMVQDAKGRFVAGDTPDMALNLDGSFDANPVSVSSMGSFFGQTTQGNGTRQLVFGTFDLQRDDTTGASTATFNGKIAWERSVSETTLLGYFIGGDLARSNIAGSFTGDQDHLGVTAGGYAVHEMAKQLYLDGFVSVGAGRNNLTMDDSVLALESDYTTRSATFGMSVSGVIGPQGYEIWPELALTVGRTWIDTVAFTGTAYGTTDDSLSLDAGMVTLANLTFRPEFRVPLDGTEVSKSLRLITLAPRLICQQTTTTTTAQTCGGGAELGLQTHSADGTTTGTAQILSDWIDGQTRTSGQLSVEMRF